MLLHTQFGGWWQGGDNLCQILLQPAVQHHICTTLHAAPSQLCALGVKQGQHLRRPLAPVLMWLLSRSAMLLPTVTCYWLGLERSRLVLCPDRQTEFRAFQRGALDQLFFGSATGSTTVTISPFLRFRVEVPVAHQLLVRGQLQPASGSTARIVEALTSGNPSGAWRSARLSSINDHVAVPSVSGSGERRASARMRLHSLTLYFGFGPPPLCGSMACNPSRLKRSTSCETASPERRAESAPPRCSCARRRPPESAWRGRRERLAHASSVRFV